MATNRREPDRALTVETHDIDHIPETRRHGRPNNQFTVRFSPVIYLAPIVVGGVGMPLGLGLAGSISAILTGNVLGAICTGISAAMGPRMGMPQLTMGRSAFGYHGNYVPSVLSMLLYVGYYTVGTILGAKSLADVFHAPYVPIAILVAFISTIIAVFGYKLFHVIGRWMTWISIIVLIAVTVTALVHGVGGGAQASASGSEYWLAWLVEFTVVFGYTMSWAPYASDYSRYLPVSTSKLKTFGWSSGGLFLATTWMMGLGSILLTTNPEGDALSSLRSILPYPLLVIALLLFGVASLPHNAVNIYSNGLTSRTWDLPLRRTVVVVLTGAIGCVLAVLFGGENFVDTFKAFLFLVTYYVMPWLAILAVDFYWKHNGRREYTDFDEFYKPRGQLGGVNWPGLGAFIIGIGVSVPFMATDWYTGPVGNLLGGGDTSYFVSFIVAGSLYAIASKNSERRTNGITSPAGRETDQESGVE